MYTSLTLFFIRILTANWPKLLISLYILFLREDQRVFFLFWCKFFEVLNFNMLEIWELFVTPLCIWQLKPLESWDKWSLKKLPPSVLELIKVVLTWWSWLLWSNNAWDLQLKSDRSFDADFTIDSHHVKVERL